MAGKVNAAIATARRAGRPCLRLVLDAREGERKFIVTRSLMRVGLARISDRRERT